jgi:hypothetical protein
MAHINDGLPFLSKDASDHFSSYEAFKDAIRLGALRWVAHKIAVDANMPDSRELRAQAARLVMPEHAIACDDYAAFIFGADTYAPGQRWEHRPTYLVPHARYVSRPGYAIVRQSTGIPDHDVIDIEGVRLTTPVRTASDILRRHYRPYALAAGDALYRAGVILPGEVADHLSGLFHLRGLQQARQLVTMLTSEAESHGESWLRCRLVDAGFPRPAIQFKIPDAMGIIRRFDMAYEEYRVAPEYDGREHHTATGDRDLDEIRREDFRRRLGWRFPIGTYECVFGEDPTYELGVGAMIGRQPLPRWWR